MRLGPLRRIEIEPAQNGVTVHHSHEQPPSKGKEQGPYVEQPKPFVFANHKAALKHIGKHLEAHAMGKAAFSDGTVEGESEETNE